MTDFIGDAGVGLAIVAGFLFLLATCGFLADYVLPHIPFVEKFIDNLPMMWMGRNKHRRTDNKNDRNRNRNRNRRK